MYPRNLSALLACLSLVLLPSVAWADGTTISGTGEDTVYDEPRIQPNEVDDGATVFGTGEATVHLLPTKLRVQVQIQAPGKTAELALQRLKARREAVAETLRGLGAEKGSISFGDPSVSNLASLIPPCCPCVPCYPAAPGGSSPSTYGPPVSPYPVPPPTVAPPSGGPAVPPPLLPGPRGSLPPATVAPPSSPLVPPASPLTGVRGDPSSPGPSGTPPPAAAAVTTPDSPLTPSAPTSPPSTYQPGATFGTSTAPAAAAVPNSTPPNASVPSSTPAYSYGSAPVPYAATPSPAPVEMYSATGTLTAEWSLAATTAEQAVLAGEAIRKKALAADLAGDKARGDASAGDQELPHATVTCGGAPPQVQMAVAQNPYACVAWNPYATPPAVASPSSTFLYVATISSQQRKAALAEAFGKAKSQAAEMAEATGGKLGPVNAVLGAIGNSGPWPSTVAPASDNETIAADPGDAGAMRFHARVSARFHLD